LRTIKSQHRPTFGIHSTMARGTRNSASVALVLLAVFAGFKYVAPSFALAGQRATTAAQQTRGAQLRNYGPGGLSTTPLVRSAVPVGFEEVAGTSAGLAFLVSAGQTVAGLVALYAIMSLSEYVYHRYFQHLGLNKVGAVRAVRSLFNLATFRGDGHVEHHRETLDDMSLEIEPGRDLILDQDPWRGTSFPWDGTLKMAAGVMLLGFPVLSFLGWSASASIPLILTAMMLHALVWNALHPNMHGLPDVPLEAGAPSWVLAGLRDSAWFKYLRSNHAGHHLATGAHGNYNVCCPGVDQLVGTNVDCVTGEPQPKPVPEWVTILVGIAAAPLMPVMAFVCLVVLVTFPPLPRAAEIN